jgi:hypothetical protein
MRVICRHALWLWVLDRIERFRCCSVHKWTEDLDAFCAFLIVGWCHFASLLLLAERVYDGACEEARLSCNVEVERNPGDAVVRLDLRFALLPATSLPIGQCFKILTT